MRVFVEDPYQAFAMTYVQAPDLVDHADRTPTQLRGVGGLTRHELIFPRGQVSN